MDNKALALIGRSLMISEFVTLAAAFFAKEGYDMAHGNASGEINPADAYNDATTALGDAVSMIDDELQAAISTHMENPDDVPHRVVVFPTADKMAYVVEALQEENNQDTAALDEATDKKEKKQLRANIKARREMLSLFADL